MKEDFKELIENYFEYKKEEFIEKLTEISNSESSLKEDISEILLFENTPLYLKELLLLVIKNSGDPFYLKSLKEFFKRCKNKRLRQIAINSFSGIKNYNSEKFLFELKKDSGKEFAKDFTHALGILYKNKNIRMLRVLLSERRDRVLFIKAADYFRENPDPEIVKFIIPLILEEREDIRDEILSVLTKINFIDEKSFLFFKEAVKKLMFKGAERSYLKKLVYTLSLISVNSKRKDLIDFYNQLEENFGDVFTPLKPYAFIPFKDSKNRLFYENLILEGELEDKIIALKNLPEKEEEWINWLLKNIIKTRNIQLTKEAFKKILTIGNADIFTEEIINLPSKLKYIFVSIAIEKGKTIPSKLIEYFMEEEDEKIVGKLLEYMFVRGGKEAENFYKGIIKKNFKNEIKREAIKYLTIIAQNKAELITYFKEFVFSEASQRREPLYLYIVNSLKKIAKDQKVAKRKKELINLLFTIFEKTFNEQTLVSIISAVREFVFCSENELVFVKSEFSDKKKELLNLKEDISSLIRFMAEVEREVEKKVAICKKRKTVREKFSEELLSLKENKERIINISKILSEFPDIITQREKEFLKRYCISEIKKPFNKRANKIAMLEIMVSLKIEEAKETLFELYKQNIPELKNSLKNTLIKLGFPEEKLKSNKIPWKDIQ